MAIVDINSFTKALFPENALQKDWRTPTEFPCCPQIVDNKPISCYAKQLCKGKIFSSNQYRKHEISRLQGLEWTGSDSIDDYC